MKKPSVANPNQRCYSQEERALLGKLYSKGSQEDLLAALPGRTWESISSAARRFGVRRTRPANYSRQWSAAHLAILHTYYPVEGAMYVAPLVGRPMRTVLSYANRIGLRRDFTKQKSRQTGRPARDTDWLLPERELLAKLYAGAPKEELQAALPARSWWGIQCQAAKQKLCRPKRFAVLWTEAENEFIRANYPTKAARATSQMLPGRSPSATRKQACLLGVKLLSRVRVKAEKVAKKRKPTALSSKKAAQPKAAPVPKATAPEPVKRSPKTPNLNTQVARRKKETTTPLGEILSAMKKTNCPPARRMAFTRAAYHGIPAAIKAWDEWPTTSQQAA